MSGGGRADTWLLDVPNRHEHDGQFEPDLVQSAAVVRAGTFNF
jgi:hypothetical protein